MSTAVAAAAAVDAPSATIYANASARLMIETVPGCNLRLLRVVFDKCEYLNTDDTVSLLSAIRAFYSMNTERFAQLIDVDVVYPPSPNSILATINLMRESHEYFKTHLACTGIVFREHAAILQKYMRSWTPTRPIHYVESPEAFYAMLARTEAS